MSSIQSALEPPTRPSRVAVVGECMIELRGRSPNLCQGFAGDTLNTAVYLSRLTKALNAQISYMTAVGEDPFSQSMLALWQEEGIDCQYVARIAGRNPGLYIISVDDRGERSFHYWRGESAAKHMFDGEIGAVHLHALTDFDWIYLSGISIAILPEDSRAKLLVALKAARADGAKFAFDNNYRPRLWPNATVACQVYDDFLSLCDLAFITLDDELAMRPAEDLTAVIARCRGYGIAEVVIKRGAEECLLVRDQLRISVPANKVSSVVDTTAAGDSFSAAYLAARIHGLTPAQAARWGHELAAEVIQHSGAIIAQEQMPQFHNNPV